MDAMILIVAPLGIAPIYGGITSQAYIWEREKTLNVLRKFDVQKSDYMIFHPYPHLRALH